MKNHMTRAARRAYIEELALSRAVLRLAAAMEQSGKTQKDVAEELGVTAARVSQMMNGDANLTIKSIARIADVLGHRFDPQLTPIKDEMPALVRNDQSPVCITEQRTVEPARWRPVDFMTAYQDPVTATVGMLPIGGECDAA